MNSHIERMNRPVLILGDTHPAKRFLTAFMDCRMNCSERELAIADQIPLDQTWTSSADGKVWTFSGFIYTFICFDIELDGYLQNAPVLTASEIGAEGHVPLLRSMMNECAEAAREDGNSEILELTDQVLEMLCLWDRYLDFRRQSISQRQA